MRKHFNVVFVFMLAAVFLAGCAAFPFYRQVNATTPPLPPGQVLVIGKFTLSPKVTIKHIKNIHGARVAKKGEMELYMGASADRPVKKGKPIPFAFGTEGLEQMNVKYGETSFVAMPPGQRYIRKGEIPTGIKSTTVYTSGHVESEGRYIELYGDLKLDIPANAKAVYIGTIVWKHDGEVATSVSVRDEYKSAMQALKKMNIKGIGPKDVKKSLAKVVRKN